MNPTDAEHNAV